MAYNLNSKSIQQMRLSTDGTNSSVKIILAKKDDVNSRFINPILYDSRGVIDCTGSSIQLNAILPDGTKKVAYGEVINGKAYVKISGSMLEQEGRLACDISYTGTDAGANDDDEDTYVLTSETFYIQVRGTVYDPSAEPGEDDPTWVEWVNGQIGNLNEQVSSMGTQIASIIGLLDDFATKAYVDNAIGTALQEDY